MRRGGLDVRGRCEVAAAAAWLIAILTFQTLSPIRELHYFLPALVPLTILAAHGLEVIRALWAGVSAGGGGDGHGAGGLHGGDPSGCDAGAHIRASVRSRRRSIPARGSGNPHLVGRAGAASLWSGCDHDRSDAVLRGSKVLFDPGGVETISSG